MNKYISKKGFTLVELLAVIVIIAIIAVIATPKIIGVIDSAREKSALSSALGYINTIEMSYNETIFSADKVVTKGIQNVDDIDSGLSYSGTRPTGGTIEIDDSGEVSDAILCLNGYKIQYVNGDIEVISDDCSDLTYTVPDSCFVYHTTQDITSFDIDQTVCETYFSTFFVGEYLAGITSFCTGGEVIVDTGYTIDFYIEMGVMDDSTSSTADKWSDAGVIYNLVYGEEIVTIDSYLMYDYNKLISFDIDETLCEAKLIDELGDYDETDIGDYCIGGYDADGTYNLETDLEDEWYSTDEFESEGIIYNLNYLTYEKNNLCKSDVVIPNQIDDKNVTSIGELAFRDFGITSLTLPSQLKLINFDTFANNLLTEVEIPSSVDTIFAGAFDNNSIETLTLNEGLTTIGSKSFADNNINSLALPSTVTSIDTFAFDNNSITTVNIPSGLSVIGDSIFSDNEITSLTLPEGIVSIGKFAFHNNNITSLVLPTTLTSIDSGAFQNNLIANITIPEGVTSIGNTVFYQNEITSIAIPNSVISIGDVAFYDNNILQGSATIDNTEGNVTLGTSPFGNNGADGATTITPVYLR